MKYIVNKAFVIATLSTMLFGFAEGTSFGIKAGVNIANMYGDDAEGLQSVMGFCGGGFATVGLGDIFAIQPEVIYTQKGAIWGEILLYPGTRRIISKLYYFETPILMKVTLPTAENVKPILFVGPYFGLNVSAKYWVEVNGEYRDEDIEDFPDIEFGIIFGGGVDLVLRKGKIVFDGRYTLGLTTASEEGRDIKNNVVSFMLGYSF